MKKCTKFIKRLLRVEYRLTACGADSTKMVNTYSATRRQIRRRIPEVGYWAIYKTGPFGLSERQVDCNMWHEKRWTRR